MIWATLRVEGLKLLFSNGKDVSIFTGPHINLDKGATESVANFAGIDIPTIEYKAAGGGQDVG